MGIGVDVLTLKPRTQYTVTEKETIYTPVVDKDGNHLTDVLTDEPMYVLSEKETTKTYKSNDELMVSVTPTIFASYKKGNWGVKGRITYAQNAAHMSMISGYAVTEKLENGDWKYSSINSKAVWPAETHRDASYKTQRNLIEGDIWPAGEIDEVSTRYIQFGMTAPTQTKIDIDKISLFVAGAGGSGMRCKAYYATNADFSDAVLIQELTSMAGNQVYTIETIPVVSIADGQSIYLRIYPWYKNEATGKTICLSDVYIHGMASDATHIETVISDHTSDKMYDVLGRQVLNPSKGNIYVINGKKFVKR
jgi:hypothetical protein